MQSRALLKLGDVEKASLLSKQSIQSMNELDPEKTNRIMNPELILFTHHIILKSQNDFAADSYLEQSYQVLKMSLDRITDPEGRQSVSNTPLNLPIVEAWKAWMRNQDATS